MAGGAGLDGSAGRAEGPSYVRVLRERPFAMLWVSQLVSQSGDFVFEVALLWLVLELTGSVFAVGLIVTATLVPIVVLGPTLGVYVDRWHRRRILILTNVAEGILVAGLSSVVLLHATVLPLLLGIVLALASAAQFVRIASSAMVPQTVPLEQLGAANGLMSFSSSVNQVAGLSIGGVVVAAFGVARPIEYDAITFFVAALLVALIPARVGSPEPSPEGQPRSFRREFGEGFGYLRANRFLIEVIALGIVANFFANAIGALFAPYAALVLHGGAVTYGLLGAMIALGSLVGALAIGKVNTRRSAGRWLFGGAAAFGVVLIAFGLTDVVPLALAEAVTAGVLLSVTNVPLLTLIQAKVPARLMGRVTAVLISLILTASPVGSFFAGSLASRTSIGFVFLLSGLVMIAICGVGALTLRELRDVTY